MLWETALVLISESLRCQDGCIHWTFYTEAPKWEGIIQEMSQVPGLVDCCMRFASYAWCQRLESVRIHIKTKTEFLIFSKAHVTKQCFRSLVFFSLPRRIISGVLLKFWIQRYLLQTFHDVTENMESFLLLPFLHFFFSCNCKSERKFPDPVFFSPLQHENPRSLVGQVGVFFPFLFFPSHWRHKFSESLASVLSPDPASREDLWREEYTPLRTFSW